VHCPNCGRENADEAAFCASCGTALAGGARAPLRYAGFWLRFIAAFIDGVVTSVASFVLGFVIGIMGAVSGASDAATTLSGLLGGLLGIAYYVVMESSSQQGTLGKLALGIKVTDLNGNRISGGRALGRNLAKIVSALILMIGYVMAAFTERKQALHDMLAGCLVVRR
jgi:uncharacterized RDD family membrane protein YckC